MIMQDVTRRLAAILSIDAKYYSRHFTSANGVVTDFVAAGGRTCLAGFAIVNGLAAILAETSFVEENLEPHRCGSRRNVEP